MPPDRPFLEQIILLAIAGRQGDARIGIADRLEAATRVDYAPFFATLRAIGYSGRLSVEASSPDVPAQAPTSIALLRKAFAGEPPAPAAAR